jgi:hypothetical protein
MIQELGKDPNLGYKKRDPEPKNQSKGKIDNRINGQRS